jgi:hypothetical protein
LHEESRFLRFIGLLLLTTKFLYGVDIDLGDFSLPILEYFASSFLILIVPFVLFTEFVCIRHSNLLRMVTKGYTVPRVAWLRYSWVSGRPSSAKGRLRPLEWVFEMNGAFVPKFLEPRPTNLGR